MPIKSDGAVLPNKVGFGIGAAFTNRARRCRHSDDAGYAGTGAAFANHGGGDAARVPTNDNTPPTYDCWVQLEFSPGV